MITDERCLAYQSPGHPERPERVKNTLAKLRAQDELPIEWKQASEAPDSVLELGHTKDHVAALKNPRRDFDGDTPAYPGIDGHARRAVGGALDAMELAIKGELAFSLMRPPGHHSMPNQAMGFCFLSSVALSVLVAAKQHGKRVAVLDFDVHHGNGTEAVLVGRPNTSFYSIHQHPCYPGTGVSHVGENCFNFPVAPRTPREDYMDVIRHALSELVRSKPDLIAVSAGFDAYARDPIAQETLEADDFWAIGDLIRRQGIPFYSVLEGGYSDDLPGLIFAYLKGISGLAK